MQWRLCRFGSIDTASTKGDTATGTSCYFHDAHRFQIKTPMTTMRNVSRSLPISLTEEGWCVVAAFRSSQSWRGTDCCNTYHALIAAVDVWLFAAGIPLSLNNPFIPPNPFAHANGLIFVNVASHYIFNYSFPTTSSAHSSDLVVGSWAPLANLSIDWRGGKSDHLPVPLMEKIANSINIQLTKWWWKLLLRRQI